MSNESQVEAESTLELVDDEAPQGRPTPLSALLDSPFGIIGAVIALGVIIGVAVFIAVSPEDTEGAAFETRPFDERASTQAEAAEWRSIIDSGQIAATYEGVELSWAELEGMLERLPVGAPEYLGIPDVDTSGQIVRQWMITLALEDELAARGVEPDAFDRQEALDQTLQADPLFDETTPYGALALETRTLTTTLDRTVADLSLEADVELPEYLCASHILVETEEEAQEIVQLLDDGAEFATLAIERSGDGSAALGGDLGCGPTIGYVAEFSDGARATGNGNISEPVRSQFGWHIISVRTIGELTPENHPEMAEAEIQQALGSFEVQARDRIANDLGNEIVDAAWDRVTVGHTLDERIGTWDPAVRFVAPPGTDVAES
ncbi:MAG: peptidylprolyl isomerase [Actinomycetota bacterium]